MRIEAKRISCAHFFQKTPKTKKLFAPIFYLWRAFTNQGEGEKNRNV